MAVRNGIYKIDNGDGSFDEINLKSNAGQISLKDGRSIQDIFDRSNKLWEGAAYMVASSVATPTKPLSNCNNGWLLKWSDYDPGDGPKNWNWIYSFIPKHGVQYNDNTYIPVAGGMKYDSFMSKALYITDTTIKGDGENDKDGGTDICLREVWEW